MLTLVIGGRSQGKSEFIRTRFGLLDAEIVSASQTDAYLSARALVHLEELVRERGGAALSALEEWLASGDRIVCCDEVGLGVVPVDRAEREYRDEVGKTLCALAARAEQVYRVIAGIGQRIK